MLTELRIRNFAIIESLSLPLAPGFNVLSGETGAGKSIVVGALGLLLGERASPDLIRTGADKATVEGVFDAVRRAELLALLDERGVEVESQTVVLRREISVSGRTRAWINNTTATATLLAEVGRLLVNVHGQHEAQGLMDPEAQRRIIDAFAEAEPQAALVRSAHQRWGDAAAEIEALRRRRADAERRADYLRHVVGEIEGAALKAGEDSALEEEAQRLEHGAELRATAESIAAALEGGDEAVLSSLSHLQRPLASIGRMDSGVARLQELFDSAFYSLEELAREMSEYATRLDLDPSRLEESRRRRDLLFRLTKKYGPSLADVIEAGRNARAELDLLDTAELDLRQLEARQAEARSSLEAEAAKLSTLRSSAADRLVRAVDDLLPSLGMPDGRFGVLLTPRQSIGPVGAEDVEFRIVLNIGHDARPLARVASGGELSRVMLALKTTLARVDAVPTLVFDEVDAGIGGRVALEVGDTMRRVAEHHQVLAITHLPQIAARAHHHIVVTKGTPGGVTTADTSAVEGNARVAEVARMLGGDPESEVSREHARELLAAAGSSDSTSAEERGAAAGRRRSAPKRSAR